MRDPKNRLRGAFKLKFNSRGIRNFRDSVGSDDRDDMFRLRLRSSSQLELKLSRLRANADLEIYELKRPERRVLRNIGKVDFSDLSRQDIRRNLQRVGRSRKGGRKSEQISKTLDAGVYYIRVTPRRGNNNTTYRLRAANTPIVDLPPSIPPANPSNPNPPAPPINPGSPSPGDPTPTPPSVPATGNLRVQVTTLSATTNTTNNEVLDISGSNVLWRGFDGNDTELFFSNGISGLTTQITNDNVDVLLGYVSGTNVAYSTGTLSTTGPIPTADNSEVFYYNVATGTLRQLTNNSVGDLAQGISGSNVVWLSQQGFDTDLFFYDGTTNRTTQITDDLVNDAFVNISGNNVAWISNDFPIIGDGEIRFFSNGQTSFPVQLTNNSSNDVVIDLFDDNVLWAASGDSFVPDFPLESYPVFLQNATTGTVIPLGESLNLYSAISDTNVALSRVGASGNPEVFSYSISTGQLSQLTNNSTTDLVRGISGQNIAWSQASGDIVDLVFYDGASDLSTILRTVDTSQSLFKFGGISGSNVAVSVDGDVLLYNVVNS